MFKRTVRPTVRQSHSAKLSAMALLVTTAAIACSPASLGALATGEANVPALTQVGVPEYPYPAPVIPTTDTSYPGAVNATPYPYQAPSPIPTVTLSPIAVAVYLVGDQGVLTASDLQAHPEIAVVHTVEDFERYGQHRIALWIDKNAGSIPSPWLNEAPQAFYPIVVVGYNKPTYAFRDFLGLCCFTGPAPGEPRWSATQLEPGFSVIQSQEVDSQIGGTVFIQGYEQVPVAQDILAVTNGLLAGRITPTSTSIFPAPASPTPPPLAPTPVP